MDDNININDWVRVEIKQLEEFHKWWLTYRERSPQSFPLEMSSGDWTEQFLAYVNYEQHP